MLRCRIVYEFLNEGIQHDDLFARPQALTLSPGNDIAGYEPSRP